MSVATEWKVLAMTWVASGVRSVVVGKTMSRVVKYSREIVELSSRDIGQPAAECPVDGVAFREKAGYMER